MRRVIWVGGSTDFFHLYLHNSEISGWLSPDEDARAGNDLFRSPIKDLPDIACDQTMQVFFGLYNVFHA
jgi:hypothetical protein